MKDLFWRLLTCFRIQRGDGLGKLEEVVYGLNNMCTMVGDITSSMVRVAGYGGVRWCGEKSRDNIRLRST